MMHLALFSFFFSLSLSPPLTLSLPLTLSFTEDHSILLKLLAFDFSHFPITQLTGFWRLHMPPSANLLPPVHAFSLSPSLSVLLSLSIGWLTRLPVCRFFTIISACFFGQRLRQGTKSCRMGRNSVRPSIRPSARPSAPLWLALRPLQTALRPLQLALRP